MTVRTVFLLVLLSIAALACDDEPLAPAPPVAAGQFQLELRDLYWHRYEHGAWTLVDQAVDLEVVVPDTVPRSKLDSIVGIEVLWPQDLGSSTLPVELTDRGDGHLVTTLRLPGSELAFGTYTLVVRFEGGSEATVDRMYTNARRLGQLVNAAFLQDTYWVRIEWTAPDLWHDWTAHLERRMPEPVEVLLEPVDGRTRGGGFQVAFSYDFQAGSSYAVVLELASEFTTRTFSFPFDAP